MDLVSLNMAPIWGQLNPHKSEKTRKGILDEKK